MVLIMSAILYLIAATLVFLTASEIHLADYHQRSTQALYVAESSRALGIAQLRKTPEAPPANVSDVMTIDNNPATLTATFHSISKSFYHRTLEETGVVPGAFSAAKRTIRQHVVVKPFAVFAENSITLSNGCKITGNVHGNGTIIFGQGSIVTKKLTSSLFVQDEGGSAATLSSQEPFIAFPDIAINQYYPSYQYEGNSYAAQPLSHDEIPLSATASGTPPPETSIHLYSGFVSKTNPVGIFYAKEAFQGPLTALRVEGTVIIPSNYPASTCTLNGALEITPSAHFPALISMKDLDLTLIEGLEQFSKQVKKTSLAGLIYSQGAITLTGNGTTGNVLTGSLFGKDIRLSTTLFLGIHYDPDLLTYPPSGIDFIEVGEWYEVFGEE